MREATSQIARDPASTDSGNRKLDDAINWHASCLRLRGAGISSVFILSESTTHMKKIEAIIKPFKLDEVKEALQEVG